MSLSLLFFLLLLIWDREGVQQTNSSNYFNWKSPDLHIQVGGENCIKDVEEQLKNTKIKRINELIMERAMKL